MIKTLMAVLAGLLVLTACETDLEVVSPADATPVVYCILDQDSTFQYLRLSRSYVTRDASVAIDDPDSLLPSRATKVAVEEVIQGQVSRRAFFTPVEVTKDSGFFPRQEHWVYRAEFPVSPETDYRLIVYLNETDRIVYSNCYTVGDFHILNPLYPEVRYVHMLPDHNLSFYWTRSLNAAIYQLGFNLHYLEIRDDQTQVKEILVPLKSIFYLQAPDNLFSYPVNSTNFYAYLSENLKHDPAILRKYLSMDAFIISGGEELGYYMRLQEGGQTFTLMDYTNITNGIGLFSSRVLRRIDGFQLTDQSVDSLAYSLVTSELNFMDRTGARRQ